MEPWTKLVLMKPSTYLVAKYCIFGGWISNKVNGSNNIVGGTMGTIYGTISIVGGTMRSSYGTMSTVGGTKALFMKQRAIFMEPWALFMEP